MEVEYLYYEGQPTNVICCMISESTTSQKAYTDDPQSAGSALVKGGDNGGFWDDDWNE